MTDFNEKELEKKLRCLFVGMLFGQKTSSSVATIDKIPGKYKSKSHIVLATLNKVTFVNDLITKVERLLR